MMSFIRKLYKHEPVKEIYSNRLQFLYFGYWGSMGGGKHSTWPKDEGADETRNIRSHLCSEGKDAWLNRKA